MDIQNFSALFNTPARREAFLKLIKDNKTKHIFIQGLEGSSIALFFSNLLEHKQAHIIIANDLDEAGYLYNDLVQINGNDHILLFPSGYKRDIKYGQPDPPSEILRTEVLNRLCQKGESLLIVTYPEAIAEKVVPVNMLSEQTLHIDKNSKCDIITLSDKLRERGFEEVDYVYEPGQFAVRGSILDVFSYTNELPYRIDFFGKEVESIRTFEVETQLSTGKLEEVYIVANVCGQEASGISILDFIDKNTILICHNLSWVIDRISTIASESLSEQTLIAEEGDRYAMQKIIDVTAFQKKITTFRRIDYETSSEANAPAVIRFNCTPQGVYHKNFDLVSQSFSQFIEKGYTLYILSDSEKQIERLQAIFEERGDSISFTPVLKTLHEGFVDNDLKIGCFTDHQIFDRFHKYTLKSEHARSGKLALSLKELNQIEVGDYIVHVDHGIGRFGGLIHTEINGKMQEVIKLTYQNDDIIFVSIHALHKLAKYRAKEGEAPRINKLGSGAWERMKEKTKGKMKEIARDLIKLYAARKEEKGFAFSPDSFLQQELEASFIYEDTPDQIKSTAEVKADMERERPMDRLICGDVGFGKTEIAIRAAFKATCDNKQVAVLVPTTVLAFQHYQTFKERLKEFPVRIEYLSRARKASEVKAILKDLADRKIDIIIGTHKLIGKDVRFNDLGLLIVDEEQKFGVAVKEKLKQMKVNVDTLTMSATPIPRTLQFSLMGARDLSVISTPPANRYPIQTEVHAFNDDIIKEAINFEMSRGGQIFFINNRIPQLYELENTIHRLVPDARVVIGHGQMPPEKLEQAIIDFVNYDYDILLATTIIESGIDMPNTNTIIINDAQNFGLSELHQLRGRVGRSNRKAFCYLLTPPRHTFSVDARRRLQAIESFSELGSGIHIAMQDLDIRGAGNLLGAEQSGFIADLGYETYQKILKEAVEELKNDEFSDLYYGADSDTKPEEFVSECTIESDLEILFPANYVPQESERISLYQELDNMERETDIRQFRERLEDRFGRIPHEAMELIRVVRLRRLAKQLGIEKVGLKQGYMYLYFVSDEHVAYYQSAAFGRILGFLQKNPKLCKLREINSRRSLAIKDITSVESAVSVLEEVLQTLPV